MAYLNSKMLVTLEAARTRHLPVWVGITSEPRGDGLTIFRNAAPLSDALDALQDKMLI